MSSSQRRIGIFAGSFDPVHKGHIAFALAAAKSANLDAVYFLPEIKPRRKPAVTHIAHRLAMLELAAMPHPALKVLELPDRQFSVDKTLPRILTRLPGAELFFLMGADSELEHLGKWPFADRLLRETSLIIACRNVPRSIVETMTAALPAAPKALFILEPKGADISSRAIRERLARAKTADGLLPSTARYAQAHWLYKTIP